MSVFCCLLVLVGLLEFFFFFFLWRPAETKPNSPVSGQVRSESQAPGAFVLPPSSGCSGRPWSPVPGCASQQVLQGCVTWCSSERRRADRPLLPAAAVCESSQRSTKPSRTKHFSCSSRPLFALVWKFLLQREPYLFLVNYWLIKNVQQLREKCWLMLMNRLFSDWLNKQKWIFQHSGIWIISI